MAKLKNYFPVSVCLFIVLFFWWIYPVYPNTSTSQDRVIPWMADAWGGDFVHGWLVPILYAVFSYMAWKHMKEEPMKQAKLGLLFVLVGILLFLISVRTLQPRIALIGIPFLIFGSYYYVLGWKAARYMIFPALFWLFGVTMPGLQQATNGLQLVVTKSCYHVGTLLGMELVNSGNDISSATDTWNGLNIAEGCSGIRSIMALLMIAAIYSYYSQKEVWKKLFLFGCALPVAMIANFFRIFTIIVLAEMGQIEFATNTYHDWAGLMFFFPLSLGCLFLIDKVLNYRVNRKVLKVRHQ